MKKSALFIFLVIGLVVLGWVVFSLSSSRALAQATEETPTAVIDSETPTPVINTEIPTSTSTPEPTLVPAPNLTVIKSAVLDNDLNKNGNIDPGEDVTYKIRIMNNGAELSNLVIEDRFTWDNFKNPNLNNGNCFFTGDKIVCKFDTLGPGITEVSYTVTLKDVLDFQGKTSKEIRNDASVLVGGILQATASTAFQVSAPTPTPSPTVTPTDTPIPSATPNPTPTQAPSGASALGQNWSSTIIVVLLAFAGIAVFTYMGGFAKFYRPSNNANKEAGETSGMSKDEIELVEKRITVFREGVIIIFIVSTVLLMGIAGALQSDGVISLLSAIVGYVFGRASSRS
jgi:hypothetical protein